MVVQIREDWFELFVMFTLIHIQHISLMLTEYDTLTLRLAYLFNVWLKCVAVRHCCLSLSS